MSTKDKRILTVAIAAIIIISITIIVKNIAPSEDKEDAIFSDEYNGLTIEILDAYVTADEDTGKAIANLDIKLANDSDHAFIFSVPHFSYNGDKSVQTLLNLDDGSLGGKIARETSKEGTVTITIDTRDLDSIKTLKPTIKVYDMKTEKYKDYRPFLSVK